MNSPTLTKSCLDVLHDMRSHYDFFQDISTSLSAGRMHHAWLLFGPVGIGKASMAKLAAAWLLSEDTKPEALFGMKNPSIKIDAEDAGTSLVLRGSHPDYKIIVPQWTQQLCIKVLSAACQPMILPQ